MIYRKNGRIPSRQHQPDGWGRNMQRIYWVKNERGGASQLMVDESYRQVQVDGVPCALTPQEFTLLQVLLENANQPVQRKMLLQGAWGYASLGDTRTVDVHIQRLRKKLGLSCIETVFRVGYLMRVRQGE